MPYAIQVFEIAGSGIIAALVIRYRASRRKQVHGPVSYGDGGVTRDRRRKRGEEEVDKVGRAWGDRRKLETIQASDG